MLLFVIFEKLQWISLGFSSIPINESLRNHSCLPSLFQSRKIPRMLDHRWCTSVSSNHFITSFSSSSWLGFFFLFFRIELCRNQYHLHSTSIFSTSSIDYRLALSALFNNPQKKPHFPFSFKSKQLYSPLLQSVFKIWCANKINFLCRLKSSSAKYSSKGKMHLINEFLSTPSIMMFLCKRMQNRNRAEPV